MYESKSIDEDVHFLVRESLSMETKGTFAKVAFPVSHVCQSARNLREKLNETEADPSRN